MSKERRHREWLNRLPDRDWSEVPEWAVLTAVLTIAALISYTHQYEVWVAARSAWPNLGPALLDGLFAAAWLRMRRRRRAGQPVGFLAWVALVLASLGTLAGNLAAPWVATHTDVGVLPYVVASIPALAFVLVWELVTGHGTRLTQRARHRDQPADSAADTGTAEQAGEPEAAPEPERTPVSLTKVAAASTSLPTVVATVPESRERPMPTLRSDEQLLSTLRVWIQDNDEVPTVRKIRDLTGVRHDRAKRLRGLLDVDTDETETEATGTGDER